MQLQLGNVVPKVVSHQMQVVECVIDIGGVVALVVTTIGVVDTITAVNIGKLRKDDVASRLSPLRRVFNTT